MQTTKITESSKVQKLVEEIARLKRHAHQLNQEINTFQAQGYDARVACFQLWRDERLQQVAAKEAELKRLLETLEP